MSDHFIKPDHDEPIEQFVARHLCETAGYLWPCQHKHFSVKWSKEASTDWWVELAECAIAAIDAYEAER